MPPIITHTTRRHQRPTRQTDNGRIHHRTGNALTIAVIQRFNINNSGTPTDNQVSGLTTSHHRPHRRLVQTVATHTEESAPPEDSSVDDVTDLVTLPGAVGPVGDRPHHNDGSDDPVGLLTLRANLNRASNFANDDHIT